MRNGLTPVEIKTEIAKAKKSYDRHQVSTLVRNPNGSWKTTLSNGMSYVFSSLIEIPSVDADNLTLSGSVVCSAGRLKGKRGEPKCPRRPALLIREKEYGPITFLILQKGWGAESCVNRC